MFLWLLDSVAIYSALYTYPHVQLELALDGKVSSKPQLRVAKPPQCMDLSFAGHVKYSHGEN